MAFGLLFLLLFIALPVTAGVILLVRSRQPGKNYPSCGKCGYDVSGTAQGALRCPECGSALLEVGILPAGGRRNLTMVRVGVLLIGVPLCCAGMMVIPAVFFNRQAAQSQAAAIQARQAAVAQQLYFQQQQQLAAAQTQAAQTAPVEPPAP